MDGRGVDFSCAVGDTLCQGANAGLVETPVGSPTLGIAYYGVPENLEKIKSVANNLYYRQGGILVHEYIHAVQGQQFGYSVGDLNVWISHQKQLPVRLRSRNFDPGGLPERPMGGDCKSPGSAFEGSNPSPATKLGFEGNSRKIASYLRHDREVEVLSFARIRWI